MKINNKIDEGKARISSFVDGLLERNRVPEEQREAEHNRLEEIVTKKIFDEILSALPDDQLEELEKATDESEEFPIEKWNSALFMEGIRPESIVSKVFREVERDYLGVENVETEETLIEEVEEGE